MSGWAAPTRTLWLLEVRLLWRYGLVALVTGLALAWAGLLLVLPPPAARAAAPWLLLLETALVGTTVVGALVLLERGQGMHAALAAAPVAVASRLAAKVGALAVLSVAAAVPIALAGRGPAANPGGLAMALLGVGLTALLGMLVAVAVAAHRQSVLHFLVALPLVLLPLLLPALLHGAGLGHPLLYAAPTSAAMDLVSGELPPGAALAWLVLAVVVAAGLARYQLGRSPVGSGRSRVGRATRISRPAGGPARALLRADLGSVRRDPLLLLVLASPLLLGLALRFGFPPAHTWLLDTYGFDLYPYRPLLVAVAVLLHVPVTFGMVGAMLVLDDVDDRAVVAVRTSPLTLSRYLAVRAGLVTVLAWLGVAVAVPLTGLAPGRPQWVVAGLLAGLVAPLFMLAALAVAGNKVEGVAAVKILGLPCYAPVAAWWLPAPAGWLLAPLPTWWVVQAQWSSGWYAVGGAAVVAVALVLLARRVVARLAVV